MQKNLISKKITSLLAKISETEISNKFYLAGGTALALQIGHRQSIDLDWFSAKIFKNSDLKKALSKIDKIEIIGEETGTLHLIMAGVKLSFLFYPHPLLFPVWQIKAGIKVTDERDIACMKLDAISSRGAKKDFIDLYFLLKKYSLEELLSLFDKKYKKIKYNRLHILKSLTYFQDAEKEPVPKMIEKISWRLVKEHLKKEVKNYLK